MKVNGKRVLLCNCEGTLPLDTAKLAKALQCGEAFLNTQLCRSQIDNFRQALKGTEEILVCCTQESPLFAEVADEMESDTPVSYVNIRERAGWSDDAGGAAAKIAALIDEATLEPQPTPVMPMTSEGVVLVFGQDETAMEAARQLSDRLNVTCVMSEPGNLLPPSTMDVPLFKGVVKSAEGHLGGFKVMVDGFASPSPSSRGRLSFGAPQNGAVSDCDLILDLSGQPPLFPAAPNGKGGERDGYFRADPANPVAVREALFKIADMVGEFEKPRYVSLDASICAHSRNRQTGCDRCLNACPTGAIQPNGDSVLIDPFICAGHGACASVCPTGAISYELPAGDSLNQRLRRLLATFRQAGGERPTLLVHDGGYGEEMIALLARTGRGLPANVLPFAVNEVTQIGIDFLFLALAYGAGRVRLLTGPAQRDALLPLDEVRDLVAKVMVELGFEGAPVIVDAAPDPDTFENSLYQDEGRATVAKAAEFLPMGKKRQLLSLALSHLHQNAPKPVDCVALDAGAPFGAVLVDLEACTLCLSCVGACPAQALGDNEDMPQLNFLETACVQCGLCRKTCPEGAITLEPRLNFSGSAAERQVIKEEQPFECIRCGTPFGAKSAIEKMTEKLSAHPMFAGTGRLDLIRMCEDCKIIVQAESESDNPFAAGNRPKVRTTDDYLAEREAGRSEKGKDDS